MSELWIKRAYLPEDEDGVVYLWLKSFAHARHNMAQGAHHERSPEERAYWDAHAPVVEWLLEHAETVVLCDPTRVHYEPGRPAQIYGFACMGPGDVVHAVVVKRQYREFAADMTRALLGDRLDRAHVLSHELPEMRPRTDPTTGEKLPGRCGVSQPKGWVYDPYWIAKRFLPRRAA